MQFSIDISKALKGLIDAQEKVMKGWEGYSKAAAGKMEAKAKQDAPWTDRTGSARQTIKGVSGWSGGDKSKMVVAVTGNMEYSPVLELAHEGRLAVLYPTVKAMSQEIISGGAEMMRRLK